MVASSPMATAPLKIPKVSLCHNIVYIYACTSMMCGAEKDPWFGIGVGLQFLPLNNIFIMKAALFSTGVFSSH